MLRYQERGNTRFDPLVKFPPEIWIFIIQNAISQFHISGEGYSPGLATLCSCIMVSKRWYKYLTGTPVLWRNIELSDSHSNGQDTAVLLATFLHLSQDCELNMIIGIPFASWELVCDKIAAHQSRITSIRFYNPVLYMGREYYYEEISKVLHFLSPLDRLTQLWGVLGDLQWLLDGGTPLEYIGLNSFSLNMLSSPGARNLRGFQTCEDIRSIMPLIGNLSLAQNVRFLAPACVAMLMPCPLLSQGMSISQNL